MKRFLKWLETKFSLYSAAVEADQSGKDIQMPNSYDCEDPFKQQQLKTLDQSSLDSSESIGVDPYNTGRFDTPKTRESRSRK